MTLFQSRLSFWKLLNHLPSSLRQINTPATFCQHHYWHDEHAIHCPLQFYDGKVLEHSVSCEDDLYSFELFDVALLPPVTFVDSHGTDCR